MIAQLKGSDIKQNLPRNAVFKTYPLPGGGEYQIIRYRDAIHCHLTASRAAEQISLYEIEEGIHKYFRETKIKSFRKQPAPPRFTGFLPVIKRESRASFLNFSDGSAILLREDEKCYPTAPYHGHPQWKRGIKSETLKAFKFYEKIGEDRAREAMKRWMSGGLLEVQSIVEN